MITFYKIKAAFKIMKTAFLKNMTDLKLKIPIEVLSAILSVE